MIATRILQAKSFVMFVIFWAAIPGFVTGRLGFEPAPVSLFLIINMSIIGKRNKLNLKLLYSLQHMSFFISVCLLGILCPSFINHRCIRPLQITRNKDQSDHFFIQALYSSTVLSMHDIPDRLLIFPFLSVFFGFGGIMSLYGLSCGNQETNPNSIEWTNIKVMKKMN